MARQKIKTCLACNRLFRGRVDAKTCSDRCRKRLQREAKLNSTGLPIGVNHPAKSLIAQETQHFKRAAKKLETSAESIFQDLESRITAGATEGGFVATPTLGEPLTVASQAQPQAQSEVSVTSQPAPLEANLAIPETQTPSSIAPSANPPIAESLETAPRANPLPESTNSVVHLPGAAFWPGASGQGSIGVQSVETPAAPEAPPPLPSSPILPPTSSIPPAKPGGRHFKLPHFGFGFGAKLALAAIVLITLTGIGAYLFGSQSSSKNLPANASSNLNTSSANVLGSSVLPTGLHLRINTFIDNGASFTASGQSIFRDQTNSTDAFLVQTAAGNNLIQVDTKTGQVIISGLQGNGSALTNLNASSISSGTISSAVLPTNVTVQGNSFNGPSDLVQLDSLGRLAALDGSLLTNVNAATLQGNSASYFTNASNISSGTLNDNRLSANVDLLNADQTVTGDKTFNGDNTFNGSNTFNGVTIQNGNFLFQSATNSLTAFQIQNAAGNDNLLIGDTINTRIGIGVDPNYTLDVNGDVNIANGQAYRINGVVVCSSVGCTPSGSSGSYIQNSNLLQTNANFNIQSANSTYVGGLISGASGQTADLLEAKQDASTVFALDPSGNVNITGQYEINGSPICTSSGCTVAAGSGSYIQNGTSLQAGANFNIESANAANVVAIFKGKSGQSVDLVQVKDGSGNVVTDIGNNGQTYFKDFSAGSHTFFQIQTSNFANNLLTADTVTGQILLPNASLSSTALLLGGDANLYRSAASTLKTDGSLVVAGSQTVSGTINSQTISSAANLTGTLAVQGSSVTVGTASATNGTIVLQNSTNALTTTLTAPNTATSSKTLTLPNETGTLCSTGSVCTGYAASTGSNYIAKNATDTSSAAAGSGNLYAFTNSSSASTGTVLSLDNGTNTGNSLKVTTSGNPGAGNALIFASNTNASPTGNLIDLQSGSSPTSKFSVNAAGAITAPSLSGNAGTATALAADPTDCGANTFATTIAASGNLTCAAVSSGYISTGAVLATKLQNAAADLGAADVNINLGNTNGSFNTNITVDGTITAGAFSGPLTGNVTGNVSGNAGTATKLQASVNINTVPFDGSGSITVTAAAGTLTGTTLKSTVVTSSLTSVGTLTSLTVTGGAASAISLTAGSGNIGLTTLTAASNGTSGSINLQVGNASGASGQGGSIDLELGTVTGGAAAGGITIGTTHGTVQIGNATDGTQIYFLAADANHHGVCKSGGSQGTGLLLLEACSATATADYAELYPTETTVSQGDIVMPGGSYVTSKDGKYQLPVLNDTQTSYDYGEMGVISEQTLAANGDEGTIAGNNVNSSDNPQGLALNGRVMTKVDTENGSIMPGDYITASSTPGVGMKATHAGEVVGRALASYSGSGVSQILVFINPSYYNPDNNLQGDNGTFDLVTANGITVNTLTVNGTATFNDDIVVNGHIIGNPDTSGTVTVSSDTSSAVHTFTSSYNTPPNVVITPESDTGSLRYWVTKTANDFTIHLSGNAGSDIKFDYFVQQ